MHARMLQERQAGNNLTDEQLEAYIKARCVPAARAPARRTAPHARLAARAPPAGARPPGMRQP
jgi:hypothetical protein